MGLFGFSKRHDICPKEKELKGIVTNYNSHTSKIKINAKLVVPQGYYFVLGKKGKVADKFEEGEHFFNYANLPYLCRKFGIDKIKDGKRSDKINVDMYFVSKEIFGGKFKTYRKVEMGTKAYGIFKAHVIGVYSYKVLDVREFMQSLLNVYDYIKDGEAEDIVESWVNELIVKELEKNNFILPDVIANNPIIENTLKVAVEKLFRIAGLQLLELKITRYKLPKEYQEECDKIMFGNFEVENKNESQQTIVEEKNNQTLQENNSQEIEENQGNIVEKNEETITQENAIENAESGYVEYIPFGSFTFQKKEIKAEEIKKPTRTFVDLNLDKLYDGNEKSFKRCLNCGAENNLDASHCSLCGEKFNKEII